MRVQIQSAFVDERRKKKLVEIAKEAKLYGKGWGVMSEWYRDGNIQAIAVAFVNDKPVAAAVKIHYRGYGIRMYNIGAYCNYDYRGKGLATRLVKAIKQLLPPNTQYRHNDAGLWENLR